MQNIENWASYVAYAAGFAAGNYIGMVLDEKLAIGHEMIRVITRLDAGVLIKALRDDGYGVTSVDAMGKNGEVGILYVIVNRKNQKHVIELIQRHNPKAFFTIENIHFVNRQVSKYLVPAKTRKKLLFFGKH